MFTSDRAKPGGRRNLYWVNADGTGEVTRLTDSPDEQYPLSWHPSGKFLGFAAESRRLGVGCHDPADGGRRGQGLDGRHAHRVSRHAGDTRSGRCFRRTAGSSRITSTEAGGTSYDVYVRPFPGPGGPWRVSTAGGIYPRWSATTHELLWVDPAQGKVMFAPFSVAGDAFISAKPQLWSPRTCCGSMTATPTTTSIPTANGWPRLRAQTQTTVQDHVVIVSHFFDVPADDRAGEGLSSTATTEQFGTLFGEPQFPLRIDALASLLGIAISDEPPIHSCDADLVPRAGGRGGCHPAVRWLT